MYATPTIVPLDPVTATASCCRIVVRVGETEVSFTNRPLCPFPAPTGNLCLSSNDVASTTPNVLLANFCAYAT